MDKEIYQLGGSLTIDSASYVRRQADIELYKALKKGDFCYIFNSRQMGKSSLLIHIKYLLEQEGYRCSVLDMTLIGSETVTPVQWYRGIIAELWQGFNLVNQFNLKEWLVQEQSFSPVQQLGHFIEQVLGLFPSNKLIIFIDEIDSILGLNFSVDDFFGLIRYFYNQRATKLIYQRLTVALFGVIIPSDLVQNKNKTPFNIGKAIDLQGFTFEDASPLAQGLMSVYKDTQDILKEILYWTGGQPFLTQKLCWLMTNKMNNFVNDEEEQEMTTSAQRVEKIVRYFIINNWQTQDKPEHLKTIYNYITKKGQLERKIFLLYQQIWQNLPVSYNESREQLELLLSGLVVNHQGYLVIKNQIYREVFHLEWINEELSKLCPYSQTLDAWLASQKTDESRLLRGQALKDAQNWAQNKSLTDFDYQFLAASQQLEHQQLENRLEIERLKKVEARLQQEKEKTKLQKILLAVISIGLLLTSMLVFFSYQNYYQAEISKIQEIVTSSEALFISNQKLEALIQAIKAKKQAQKLLKSDSPIHFYVDTALSRAVFGITEYNRLLGHNAAVIQVAFSPDGQTIATSATDNTIKLWHKDGSLIKTLTDHRAPVTSIAFSPDGKMLASGSVDKMIKLWTTEGILQKSWQAHQETVRSVLFSSKNNFLISASLDKTIKIWDTNGVILKTIPANQQEISRLDISPKGDLFASGGYDGTVKLWSSSGILLRTFSGQSSQIIDITVSPDGQKIAFVNSDKTIQLLNIEGKDWKKDQPRVITLRGHKKTVRSVSFSPDSQKLASGGLDAKIMLWDLHGRVLQTLEGHQVEVWSIAFSPDGQTLASANLDNTIRLWKIASPLLTHLTGHEDAIWGIAVRPDGKGFASASVDKTIKLWGKHGEFLKTLRSHQQPVTSVAFSSDSQLLISGSMDRTVKLWREDGQLLKTFNWQKEAITDLSFNPKNTEFAGANVNGELVIESLDGKKKKILRERQNSLEGVRFSPDGQRLAYADNGGKIMLCDQEGNLLKSLSTQEKTIVRKLAFSFDSQRLASVNGDGTVKLWDRDGNLLKTFPVNDDVFDLDFSPDGNIIVTANANGKVNLWQLDGQLIKILVGHQGQVYGVKFTPDGKAIVSASSDQTLIIWNWEAIKNNDTLSYGCNLIRDYLKTSSQVNSETRHFCAQD